MVLCWHEININVINCLLYRIFTVAGWGATHLVISSVLTARGVPGGTAARTFVDAYLEPGSIYIVYFVNLYSYNCFSIYVLIFFWFCFCFSIQNNNAQRV